MLRNRTRSVSNKQALMADHNPLSSQSSSSSQNQTKPSSSFFTSPRFFNGFLKTELTSPNSTLDTKLFSPLSNNNNPFPYDRNQFHFPNNFSGNKQGLAIADSLNDEMLQPEISQPNTRMVLFGRNLKIQIPQFPPCLTDFGTKTPKPQLMLDSSYPPPTQSTIDDSEMELSEDYTRVISHGSNPKTTHIYDNYVVEKELNSSCVSRSLSGSKLRRSFSAKKKSESSFLSFCYGCKKKLDQGKDIYMYGGEKAFCSSECRQQEMMSDGII